MENPVLDLLVSCESIGRDLMVVHGDPRDDYILEPMRNMGNELTQIAGDAWTYQHLLSNKLQYSSAHNSISETEQQFADASANTLAPLQSALSQLSASLQSALSLQSPLSLQSALESFNNRAFHDDVDAIQQNINQLRSTVSSNIFSQSMEDALVHLNGSRTTLARSFKSLKYAIETNLGYSSHIDRIGTYFSNNPPSGNVVSDLLVLHRDAPFVIGGPQLSPDKMPQHTASLGDVRNIERLGQVVDAMYLQGQTWAEEVGAESSLGDKQQRFADLVDAFWGTTLEQSRPIAPLGHVPFANFETFLRRVVAAPSKPTFTVAIFGVVNSGKSTVLNAIIGQEVLPASNQAATALPCHIRHEKGLKRPLLTYDPVPFRSHLAIIRQKIEQVKGNRDWDALPMSTQKNDKLYNGSWSLPDEADGREAIHELLNDINDICRVCSRFELASEVVSVWPTISVEFSSLPDDNSVDFEFIDVPGYGEHLISTSFVPIIKKVVEQSDAIAVVLSPNLDLGKWKELPGLLGKVDLVVCTHLDTLSTIKSKLKMEMKNRQEIISPVFNIDSNRIMFCSALQGLGAQILLNKTTAQDKPSIDFEDDKLENEIKVIKVCCFDEQGFKRKTPAEFLESLTHVRDESKIPELLNELEKLLLRQSLRKKLGDNLSVFYDNVADISVGQNNFVSNSFFATLTFNRVIEGALATWKEKQPNLKTHYVKKLETALQNLSSSTSYDSVAAIALSRVRTRWENADTMKIKYDDGTILQLTDDLKYEDLEDQLERFKRELGESLQEEFNKKVQSIVRSVSLEAGKALIADVGVQLQGQLSQDAIEIEDYLKGVLDDLVDPEKSLKNRISINVSSKTKSYGPKFSDFALPALASLAYFPIGAMVLGGLSVIRWFKDKKVKIKERDILSSLREQVANVERNSRPQCKQHVIKIMDTVAGARKEEIEGLKRRYSSNDVKSTRSIHLELPWQRCNPPRLRISR